MAAIGNNGTCLFALSSFSVAVCCMARLAQAAEFVPSTRPHSAPEYTPTSGIMVRPPVALVTRLLEHWGQMQASLDDATQQRLEALRHILTQCSDMGVHVRAVVTGSCATRSPMRHHVVEANIIATAKVQQQQHHQVGTETDSKDSQALGTNGASALNSSDGSMSRRHVAEVLLRACPGATCSASDHHTALHYIDAGRNVNLRLYAEAPTFNVYETRLRQVYMSMDNRVAVLTQALELVMERARLQGLMPLCLPWMLVVYFLQRCEPPVLPNVHALDNELGPVPKRPFAMDPKLIADRLPSTTHLTVGMLWLDMLNFYGRGVSFKFEDTVICLQQPGRVTRDARKDRFSAQFTMAVADAEFPNVNITRSVPRKDVALLVSVLSSVLRKSVEAAPLATFSTMDLFSSHVLDVPAATEARLAQALRPAQAFSKGAVSSKEPVVAHKNAAVGKNPDASATPFADMPQKAKILTLHTPAKPQPQGEQPPQLTVTAASAATASTASKPLAAEKGSKPGDVRLVKRGEPLPRGVVSFADAVKVRFCHRDSIISYDESFRTKPQGQGHRRLRLCHIARQYHLRLSLRRAPCTRARRLLRRPLRQRVSLAGEQHSLLPGHQRK